MHSRCTTSSSHPFTNAHAPAYPRAQHNKRNAQKIKGKAHSSIVIHVMSAQMAPAYNTGSWQVNLSAALLLSSVSVVRGTMLRRNISPFEIHVQARCGGQTQTCATDECRGMWSALWRQVGGRVWLVAVVAQEEPMVGSEHFNNFYNCDNFRAHNFMLPIVLSFLPFKRMVT